MLSGDGQPMAQRPILNMIQFLWIPCSLAEASEKSIAFARRWGSSHRAAFKPLTCEENMSMKVWHMHGIGNLTYGQAYHSRELFSIVKLRMLCPIL